MANVLTDLAADIYVAADRIGRELTGVIASSTINSNGVERAAIGQNVRSFFTRPSTAVDIAPSMTIPQGTDQTVDNKVLTLTKQRGVQIPWTGEDIKYVQGGSGYTSVYGDQIAQAMRTLANEVEVDMATEAYLNASRAVGTAGTAPFGTDYNIMVDARQAIVDNGMPTTDGQLSLVLNTLAGGKLRKLAVLQQANTAGGTDLLRNGVLLDLQGIKLRESAGIQLHTKGTGASYVTNITGGPLAIGSTVIGADTGSGTIVQGDVLTATGDTNNYVVGSALSAGNVTLNAPGLRKTLADGVNLTVGGSYTANVLFHKSALELAMRAPAVPVGGDAAVDVMIVQDPFSGLVFEVSVYKGFKKAMILVGAVWGFKAWKPDAIINVMG